MTAEKKRARDKLTASETRNEISSTRIFNNPKQKSKKLKNQLTARVLSAYLLLKYFVEITNFLKKKLFPEDNTMDAPSKETGNPTSQADKQPIEQAMNRILSPEIHEMYSRRTKQSKDREWKIWT